MSDPNIRPPDRQEGFYWVLFVGAWEVAFWSDGEWFLTGNELPFLDEQFTEIGERLDPPALSTPKLGGS